MLKLMGMIITFGGVIGLMGSKPNFLASCIIAGIGLTMCAIGVAAGSKDE